MSGRIGIRLLRLLGVAALGVAVSGCGSPPPPAPPPPRPPTIAELTVSVAMDANPDLSGRASPVVVRVYELTGPLSLMQADFMKVYAGDAAVLGPDLRSRVEFTLSPGQQQPLKIELKPDSRGVAVVALFRDYLNANWRDYAEVPADKTTRIQANIGARHVTVAPVTP